MEPSYYRIILFTLTSVVILLIGCTQQKEEIEEDVCFVQQNDTTHPIHPFNTAKGKILMMPSYWEKDKLLIKDNHHSQYITFDSTTMRDLHIVRSQIPTVYIQTESGSMDYLESAKTHEERGIITVWNENGFMECLDDIESIHGRGNVSWGGTKKKNAYSIKTNKKVTILGLKKARKFNLICQRYDYTGLRNWLAYSAAKRLCLPNQINYCMSNVYFNGHYGGCYLITNKVDINKSGVNIHNSEKDDERTKEVSGGFLMEIEGRKQKALNEVSNALPIQYGGYLMIKSPKHASDEQIQYIQRLWGEMEDALTSYSRGVDYGILDSIIDLSSFVKNYLCQEVFMNIDAGACSFFLYKDCDTPSYNKIVSAPIWDFDTSISNPRSPMLGGKDLCEAIYAGAGVFPDGNRRNSIWGALYKNHKFRQMVSECYFTEMRPIVDELIWGATWDSIYSSIRTDMEIDNLRWCGESYFVPECKQMKQWMEKRLTYLDNVWRPDSIKEKYNVYFEISHTMTTHFLLYPTTKGTILDIQLPAFDKHVEDPKGYIYDFTGWSIDGNPVNLDTLHIQHNLHIKSEWKVTKVPKLIQYTKNWWQSKWRKN